MKTHSSIEIIIFGEASQSEVFKKTINEIDEEQTLLEFLQSIKLPIASSCLGKGICTLCVVNESELSCQITLKSFVRKVLNDKNQVVIRVTYL